MKELPGAGDVVYVARAASVQFGPYPFLFRVIRVLDWDTYHGWAWLEGYQLDNDWHAVERRRIFVQPAGLYKVGPTAGQPKPAGGAGAAPSGADRAQERGVRNARKR